jgi:hypothetical protein
MEATKLDCLAIILVLGLFFYLHNLDGWRINDDEGSYLYQAWRISEGEVPYRDFFTPQWPLFLYAGAGVMRIFGPSVFAVRALSACLTLAASILLFATAKRAFNSRVGLLAMLAFLLHPQVYRGGRVFRSTAYMLFFEAMGLYLFTLACLKGERRDMAICGAAFALATLSKPLSALPLGGCLLFLGWRLIKGHGNLGDVAALLLPYSAILGTAFGFFQLLIPDFYQAVVGHHLMQGRELGWPQILGKGFDLYKGYFLDYAPFLVLTLPAILKGGHGAIFAWQIPTALAFLPLSRGLAQRYLAYLTPSLSILFARSLTRLPGRILAWSLAIVVLVPWLHKDLLWADRSERVTSQVVECIQAATDEDDFIISDYQGLNFYARRRTTYWGASLSAGAAASGQITGRKLMEEMQANDVKMVLLDTAGDHILRLRDYPCLRGYLEANFRQISRFKREEQRLEVYLIKDSPLVLRQAARPEYLCRANLGGLISLMGYSLPTKRVRPGEKIRLTLLWQAVGRIENDFTVFTHLIDGKGIIWGQKDNRPLGGSFPTNCWGEGVVVDEYEIPVSVDAPPGEYRIEVGMYRWETMERLPAYNENGTRLPQDRILLEPKVVVE